MARGITNNTMRTIMIVAGVVLVIGLLTAGLVIPLVVIFLLLLVLGGGALMYRKMGPPER
jgi:Flp pilus assembly protein TadB